MDTNTENSGYHPSKFIRIVQKILFVMIVVGLGLLLTQKVWVPKLVSRIIENDPSSQKNYSVLTITSQFESAKPSIYVFSITDGAGQIVKNFKIEHEKILHLIVVKKDLSEFQHVHPDFKPDSGVFYLKDLVLPSDGQYRIFADFTPTNAKLDSDGEPLSSVAQNDVVVGKNYKPKPLGTTPSSQTFDGYNVSLKTDPQVAQVGATMFSFNISKNGKSVTDLEDYLGALGHAVVIKEGTLEYIHTHALETPTAKQNGTVDFHVEFPTAGNYKIFMQFKHAGKVTTSSFVVPVAESKLGTVQSGMHMMQDGTMMKN